MSFLLDRAMPSLSVGRLFPIIVLALAVLTTPVAVSAQERERGDAANPPGAAAASDSIDTERLIRVLEDPAERQILIDYLRMLEQVEERQQAEAEGDLGAVALEAISGHLARIGEGLGQLGAALADLPAIADWASDQALDDSARDLWLEIALRVLAALVAAVVARWLVCRLIRRPMRLLAPPPHERIPIAIPMQLGRLLLALLVPAAVAGGAYAVFSLLQTRETTRLVLLAILQAYLIVAVILVVARELFAPHSVFVRVAAISGETAAYLLAWTRRLATVGVYGYFAAQIALLFYLPPGAFQVLLRLLGLVMAGLAIVPILQSRQGVAARIRGTPRHVGGFRNRLAEVWHLLAIVYVIAFYLVWALAIEEGFVFLLRATVMTVVIVALAQLVLYAIARLLHRAFSFSPDIKLRYPGLEARANRYLPALRRFLKAVVFVAFGFAILEVWGFGTLTWLGTDAGAAVFNTVALVILVGLLALALSEFFGFMVERYMRRLDERHVSSTRARTLLPLLRTAFRIVLIVMVSLVVLSQIGVDIAPLLAGAGVVGLAIGFGSQKLVQDVITGFFILVDDSISVGDVVEAGGHSGVVERMTIRTIEMRDLDGTVHTVPFSSVSTIKNYSKDFAFAVVDIGVAYRENTDRVVNVLAAVGEEMRAESTVKDAISGPLEVLGIDQLADSAVTIKARFRTLPLQQWSVKREFLRRIKIAFDREGIEIPFPQQTIHVAGATAPEPFRVQVEQPRGREHGDVAKA